MRNYRFRLSDMMPNAWFYKLKDMGKSRNQSHSSHPILKKHIHPTSHPPNPKHHSPSLYYHTKHKFHSSPINPKSSDTHFPETPPRKSTKKTRRRAPRTSSSSSSSSTKVLTSSVSAGCSFRATLSSAWKPDSPPTDYSASPGSPPPPHQSLIPSPPESFDHGIAKWSSSCNCRVTSSATDIIIDVDTKRSFGRKFDDFDSIPGLELPSIVTKPPKFDGLLVDIEKKEMERLPNKPTRQNCSIQLQERKEKNGRHGSAPGPMKILKEGSSASLKEETTSVIAKRPSFSSAPQGGLKIRSNSPRIASKKIQACNRKSVSVSSASSRLRRRSVSESFAVIKSSFDPQRDFRDSMVEMIIENNIRASKDLEELLACYLSLNSDEYHDLIVKVFEQIWFDLTDLRL